MVLRLANPKKNFTEREWQISYSFIHSFISQIFIKCPLCVVYFSSLWRFISEQNPSSYSSSIQVEETGKRKEVKYIVESTTGRNKQ